MDKLEKLLSQVRVYVNEDKQRRAEAFWRGECYNVFNVLGVDNMELSHSAFLAALLDPNGSHGMQDAFLKAFIDTIAHGGTKPELDTAHAKVYTEYNIGNITETTGGRIDILITDRSDTGSGKAGGHAIIIENKIWAADQPNQLVRYHNFAPKATLLYLTLNGDEPSAQSRGTLNAKTEDTSVSLTAATSSTGCANVRNCPSTNRVCVRQYFNISTYYNNSQIRI